MTDDLNGNNMFFRHYIAPLIATDEFEFPTKSLPFWDVRPLGSHFLQGGVN